VPLVDLIVIPSNWLASESRRVIATGLTGGEWVVVNGVLKAAPGRPVTPEREGAPGPEARPSLPEKKAAP